jgi:hypothetical protein
MGNHTAITSNLRAQTMSPRHPTVAIGNGTVDQTSDRLAASEIGRVVVDVIARDLERCYEHDGMPILPMRRTSASASDLALASLSDSSSGIQGQADAHDTLGASTFDERSHVSKLCNADMAARRLYDLSSALVARIHRFCSNSALFS